MDSENGFANTTDRIGEEVEATQPETLAEQIQGVLTDASQTIGDLIQQEMANSVTAASAFEITLPGGTTITLIDRNDPRMQQVAPAGTTVSPKASAKAGIV